VGVYTTVIYPAVLIVCALLALVALVTLVYIQAHRVLTWIVTVTYVAVAVQAVVVVAGLIAGAKVGIVITAGYLIATIALLPLLGIARLGHPDADDPDPNRPILEPDQIARVDAAAALIVALALVAAAWRLTVIFGA
jgi:hypothetical protein